MMVESIRLRLWSKCVFSGPTLCFLELKQSVQRGAKSRKVAFRIHSTCSVTEESDLKSHQAPALRSRRRVVHR